MRNTDDFNCTKNQNRAKRPLFKCFNHYNNPEQCKHYHVVLYNDLYDVILERVKVFFNEFKDSQTFENLVLKLMEQRKNELAEEEKERIFK